MPSACIAINLLVTKNALDQIQDHGSRDGKDASIPILAKQSESVIGHSEARSSMVQLDLYRRGLGHVREHVTLEWTVAYLGRQIWVDSAPSLEVLGQNLESLAVTTLNLDLVLSSRIDKEMVRSLLKKSARLGHGVGIRQIIHSRWLALCLWLLRRLLYGFLDADVSPLISGSGVNG